jgi:hypothetical protein
MSQVTQVHYGFVIPKNKCVKKQKRDEEYGRQLGYLDEEKLIA